jgi:DedD protein
MARTISDEELQLKRRARRRLIGAVVLVTAIVVVLPMVLDSEPRPASQPISVQIPPPDSGGFAPKLAPTNPPKGEWAPVVPSAKIAAAPPAPEPVKEAPPPVAEPPKEAPKEAEAPKAAAKPKPSKAAAKTTGGRYVVQVIALADAGKAQQMQEKIAGAGIKSYTEVVKTAKGNVTRVRAGPFASRSAAEKAREQLKALGMSGNITTK